VNPAQPLASRLPRSIRSVELSAASRSRRRICRTHRQTARPTGPSVTDCVAWPKDERSRLPSLYPYRDGWFYIDARPVTNASDADDVWRSRSRRAGAASKAPGTVP
jgi:hypothetical protein